MLSDPRRQQLDSIVRRMVDNKESDGNIKLVVNDFGQKYSNESTPSVPGKSLVQKVGGFLGIEKFGQGIATAGRNLLGINQQEQAQGTKSYLDTQNSLIGQAKTHAIGDPRREGLLKTAQQSPFTSQEEIDSGLKLSNKEVLGSAANVGLNVLAPGAFKGGLAAQAAKSAALGAGFGAAGGLNENKDLGGVAKSTALGAAIGGAIPVAGAGLSKAKEAITQKLPEALMNHAVKPTLDELRKNIKTGSDTLGRELLSEGIAGSPEKLLKISDNKLSLYEGKLQNVLKKSKGLITKEELSPYFKDITEKLKLTPGSSDSKAVIESLFADIPENMNLQKANQMKRNIYEKLRGVAYKLDPKLSDQAQMMKVLARALKTEVERKSGNPKLVNQINQRLSTFGRLEDRVVDILARDTRNKLVSLTDTIAGSAGFVNPMAWAGLALKKGSESEAALTHLAKLLNKGGDVGNGLVGKTIKQGAKRALLNVP